MVTVELTAAPTGAARPTASAQVSVAAAIADAFLIAPRVTERKRACDGSSGRPRGPSAAAVRAHRDHESDRREEDRAEDRPLRPAIDQAECGDAEPGADDRGDHAVDGRSALRTVADTLGAAGVVRSLRSEERRVGNE